LVKHPQGDLLIGFGGNIGEQFATLPLMVRAVDVLQSAAAPADLLTVAGYYQKSLRAILLTHAHWGSLYRADNNRIGLRLFSA
jgi:hypothetical protein